MLDPSQQKEAASRLPRHRPQKNLPDLLGPYKEDAYRWIVGVLFRARLIFFHFSSDRPIGRHSPIQRQLRMKNYLKVIAQIFYEDYDERKFPTVLTFLMNQINRIEGTQTNEEQLQVLTNRDVQNYKDRFNIMLKEKEQKYFTRTYKITYCLIICIFLLILYYLLRG